MKADWTSIMEKPLHYHEGCEEAVVQCPGSRPPINPKARKCTASSSAANWKDSAAELQVDVSTETPPKTVLPLLPAMCAVLSIAPVFDQQGHSGEYGNAAKLVRKMSKSVMRLILIHF